MRLRAALNGVPYSEQDLLFPLKRSERTVRRGRVAALSRPCDFCQLRRKKKSIARDIDGSSAPFYGLTGIDGLPTKTYSGSSLTHQLPRI